MTDGPLCRPAAGASAATATAHVRVQMQAPIGSPGKAQPKSMKQAQQTRLDKWYWPGMLVGSMLLAMCTQVAMRGGIGAAGQAFGLQLQEQHQLSMLEQQLYGCRTIKSQPIPFVDTTASLRILNTYTPEQQQTAQRFTAAVQACTTFACLREANKLPRAPGQFRFPSFLVVGFPKCATTSIYCHLIQHPQVQYAQEKESHVLVQHCNRNLSTCPVEVQQRYIVEMLNMGEAAEAQFTRAAFDGSTHYAVEAHWLAEQLKAELPWVKIVISMRDPVSQAIAMFLHNLSHNRSAPCWDNNGQRVYTCVLQSLEQDKRARYAPKIAHWMEHFPPEQLHILQYEALTSKGAMSGVLQRLKSFLGIDEHLPSDVLPLTNWKHMRGDPNALGRYWNMTRTEYEHVVDVARRNSDEVIKLLGQHGHADQAGKNEWARNWERIWQDNLKNNCEEGPAGSCKIVVS